MADSPTPETAETIIVGYTPTDAGSAALGAAVTEARYRNARLAVVNISRADAVVDPHLADDADLQSMDLNLDGLGVPHEIVQVLGREPADEILRLAEETEASLIVIGLRRRSTVGKLLLGSTAQRILMHAPCPVLSIRP